MREHLASAAQRTGKVPARLAAALPLPDGLNQLWLDFLDLHASRANYGFGPARITFQDIDAWQRVNRIELRPWQIEAIRAADNAFLSSVAKQGGK